MATRANPSRSDAYGLVRISCATFGFTETVRGLSSQPRLRHHASVMIALSAAMIENASDAYGLDENLDSMHPHALLRGERVRGREQADSVTVVVVAYTGAGRLRSRQSVVRET
ncbi:unnamed protein product [Trichogramma brassicae]|uniref:Uncharacterized protein n=1 Tax=Trichogramma brassicae TaxID=86971 RepID=A0A6H5HSQ3_9HYME|nr:unnamed protein product [Trichogramma brassicae]CAB0033465.1 unnamed protein product [Trichogramma brassicae]CAB0037850.1 unnamed protein product [Trichogramma brassicae]